MYEDSKLMDMLTGYAASHRHPFNVFVHMIGIPTIMLGVLIPLCWVALDLGGITISLAHVLVLGFFLFYLTLDTLFAFVFLAAGLALSVLAGEIAELPIAVSGSIAGAAIVAGYAAQFTGHAVEKSMPVLVRHPIQAQLAAPFFTVVELFSIAGLRSDLFDEVQRQVAARRREEDDPEAV